MLVNEVCALTNLTKKAISYYEKQGLIKPKKASNGYREYSDIDVNLLNEISLYRKLDISIKDIKLIVNSKDKNATIKKIMDEKCKQEIQLKIQKAYLQRILDNDTSEINIKTLNDEITKCEKCSGDFIRKELIRSFPSGLGRYLSHHFAPYLNEPLDTNEKYKAWLEIVDFLDSIPEIKIPKIIEKCYENTSDEMYEKLNDNMRIEMNKMFNATQEELEEYKKKMINNIDKCNDNSIFKKLTPFYKFKKELNEFFNSSGYYNVFLPNIKIISSEYKEYHDKLTEFNDGLCKELGLKYDENMRVIRDNGL